jgi:hypothetical protein
VFPGAEFTKERPLEASSDSSNCALELSISSGLAGITGAELAEKASSDGSLSLTKPKLSCSCSWSIGVTGTEFTVVRLTAERVKRMV